MRVLHSGCQPLPPALSSKIPRLCFVPLTDTLHPKMINQIVNKLNKIHHGWYQLIFLCVIFVLLYQLCGEISQRLRLLSRSISPAIVILFNIQC